MTAGADETVQEGPPQSGVWESLIAVLALLPALAGALTITVPVAWGLTLVAPVWTSVVPIVVWVLGPVAVSSFRRSVAGAERGRRMPDNTELRMLRDPVLRALRRVGISAGQVELMIVESREPNAPAMAGRVVAVTSYALESLPADQLEAVLAHELSHHVGVNALPVFCHRWLLLPTRVVLRLADWIRRPLRATWRVVMGWRVPIAFLVKALFALVVTAAFAVALVPAFLAAAGVLLSRFSADRIEFRADAYVVGLGLGGAMLAALEESIEADDDVESDRMGRLLGLPPLAVRRAQRLRAALAH